MANSMASKAVNSSFSAFGRRGGRSNITRLSTWNIRSGSTNEQLERLVLEVGRKDLDYCALQEVRLANSGTKQFSISDLTLTSPKSYHYTLLFSGAQRRTSRCGNLSQTIEIQIFTRLGFQ